MDTNQQISPHPPGMVAGVYGLKSTDFTTPTWKLGSMDLNQQISPLPPGMVTRFQHKISNNIKYMFFMV